VKYVDQVSILGNLSEENVTKFLGIASEQTIITFIKHIVDKKSELLFEEIATCRSRSRSSTFCQTSIDVS
jgi:DNA polymerase III gamma/tau subunit